MDPESTAQALSGRTRVTLRIERSRTILFSEGAPMAFSSSSSPLSATPNVTPLIDVLLVLLIIFLVIVPVAPHGLESLIPTTTHSPQTLPQPSPSVLELLAPSTGKGVLYRLNGEELDNRRLQVSLRESAARSAGLPLFIDGDRRLDYGAIARVVAQARKAGFETISLLPRLRS